MNPPSNSNDIFISYARPDVGWARALAESLRQTYRVWVDIADIGPGERVFEVIAENLLESRLLVLLGSESSWPSTYVMQEVTLAIDNGILVLPVMIDGKRPPPNWDLILSAIQYLGVDSPPTVADAAAASVALLKGRTTDKCAPSVGKLSPTSVAESSDPYDARVTSSSPCFMIFLVDCSHSMSQRMVGGEVSKRDAVADAINGLLYEVLEVSTSDDGTVRPRFEFSVIGYGLGSSGQDVRSLLRESRPRLSVTELEADAIDTEMVEYVIAGHIRSLERPVWIKPMSNVHGHSRMIPALEEATRLVRSWARAHALSMPPIVLNLTDGGWTGDDPTQAARRLREGSHQAPGALLFNCVLAGTSAHSPVEFPDSPDLIVDKKVRDLFMWSSVLPPSFARVAMQRGYTVSSTSRCFILDATPEDLVDLLNIGTPVDS